MMRKNNKTGFALTLLAITGFAMQANARPNINSSPKKESTGQLKTTAASCRPAEASIDLDINNIRAKLMTGGDMWWDIGTAEARYEVPKGSKKNSLFAGSVWIGGFDQQGQLKVAAQTYRQDGNDYWPGPLDQSAAITEGDCSEWDRFWKINRSDLNKFRDMAEKSAAKGDPVYDAIIQWPAKGNKDAVGRNNNPLNLEGAVNEYAQFVDVSGPGGVPDGLYQWDLGDYPLITGDQYIWWVFNDKGNTKQQTQSEGIGVEVQASAFAYSSKDALNDATFYNYRLLNRSNLTLDSTYIATWTDADLGYYLDDYIGCDTTRGLGILYNGKSEDGDGTTNSYGSKVPMVGIDFFKGPLKPVKAGAGDTTSYVQLSMESFTYYNNDNSVIGNPNNGAQIYYYMTGSIRNGQRFSNDFTGPNVSRAYGSGYPTTRFVYFGDPDKPEWSECYCQNPPADRRFVHSSGPFKLEPGVKNDITIGAVWVSDAGGCPTTSFKKIRVADDLAQGLFDNNFETIEGPEAPRMEVRELDRKLVFYIVNDPASNNYREKYGRDTAKKYRVSSVKAAKYVKSDDSLYKFEGYRVFQLKNGLVQPAQIFSENGTVNSELAAEVFQCDIKNGVTRIINYDKNTEVSDSTYIPIIKVNGRDSGLRHSFQLELDLFATGSEKRLVNYRSYYYVAVAYAYNEFAPFNPNRADSTQDLAYIESAHGAGGTTIPVVTGMPNPANGNAGTVLNSDYGDGVIIKRLEGTGNGHVALQLSDESEKEALFGMQAFDASGNVVTVNQSVNPVYKAGAGPVDIKVIDPVKIPAANWELYITGANQPLVDAGLDSFSTWRLINTSGTKPDTIYSENINGLVGYNEQIIERYGLSLNIQQYKRPGVDQVNGNGLISSDIIFEDPAKPWLAGVNDAEARDLRNWIRSGQTLDTYTRCDFNDKIRAGADTNQVYESLLGKYATTRGSWAPYTLAATESRFACGFGVAKDPTADVGLYPIPSVDVVLTSDKSKWTRCVVLELQDSRDLAQGGTSKFDLRSHASWNMDMDADGRPVYASGNDTGMSWFPGYAINQETGERLNIAFGEDSWLKSYGGTDMIWNPTSDLVSNYGEVLFGGKHYIYVMNSRYDSCRSFLTAYSSSIILKNNGYKTFMWVGLPLLNNSYQLRSLKDGIIPTDVRIKMRVDRPYGQYLNPFKIANDVVVRNDNKPLYSFSTAGLAVTPVSEVVKTDKQRILDNINVVPNPYYGSAGYENNRLDSRVRIINLPPKAVVNIYTVDGTLIRRLEKDNPNVSYLDWDIRNAKGLQIAGGMYLMHVEANGIGETVLKWFGAMRPLDIITY